MLMLDPFGIVTRFSFLDLLIYLLVLDCAVDGSMLPNRGMQFGLRVTGWSRRFLS